jgi:uncharacterized membrane protein
MSAHDKWRWVGIIAGFVCMVIGALYPVPLDVLGMRVTDNTFLAVGAVGMLIVFGAVQLVQAWRRQK